MNSHIPCDLLAYYYYYYCWFGITSTALSWVKSYLLNRSFYVNIDGSISLCINFSMVSLKVQS